MAKSSSISALRLTPEEQGVRDAIALAINWGVHKATIIENSNAGAAEARRNGNLSLAKRHALNRLQALTEVRNCLGLHVAPKIGKNPVCIYPESMQDLRNATSQVGRLAPRMAKSMDSKAFSAADQADLESALLELKAADQRQAEAWSKRVLDANDVKLSHNLSLEMAGIPLKVDFVQNEVKVKWSGAIGPFKWTAATGPSSNSGIKTLILRDKNTMRIFAVGGKSIQLHVPESIVTTEGSTMTISAIR